MNRTKFLFSAACLALMVSSNVSARHVDQDEFDFRDYDHQDYQGDSDYQDNYDYRNAEDMDWHAKPALSDPSQGQYFLKGTFDKIREGIGTVVGVIKGKIGGLLGAWDDKLNRLFDDDVTPEETKQLLPDFCKFMTRKMKGKKLPLVKATLQDLIDNPDKFGCTAKHGDWCIKENTAKAELARDKCFND